MTMSIIMRMKKEGSPVSASASSLLLLLSAAAAAFLINSHTQPESATSHRHLRLDPKTVLLKSDPDSDSPALVADESNGIHEIPPVYTYECPDHRDFDRFLHKGIDPDGANKLSFLSGALTTVSETLSGLTDTKIVLIGDSVMHQIYLSLSCMSHRAGAWESNTSFVGDRRVWLKNNSEIIFSMWGGNLLRFDWNKRTYDQPPSDDNDPFYDNTDWIEACEKREPFQQVTYNKAANSNILSSKSENDHTFEEKIVLTRDDNVFIYGTLHNHGVHRIENMQKLHRLFECMAEAKSLNEVPGTGWPAFTYIATPAQHFPASADGHWSGPTDLSLTCSHRVDLSKNQFYEEENQLEGKVSMIGREIGTSKMGDYHLGLRRVSNRQMTVDCTHWSMPGVPDLYAKEVMKWIDSVSIKELSSPPNKTR